METVGFDYGQRHAVEMQARQTVRDADRRRAFPRWAGRLGEDHVLDLTSFGAIAETAMTSQAAFEIDATGACPRTFVPGRNLVFFVYAAALADRRGARALVGGMCETDYSGYPDCRRETLDALQQALNLGMGRDFTIETPLMWLTKAQTWALAKGLGGKELGGADPRREPHLLRRRARQAPRLGPRLRRLPGLRAARQGLGRVDRGRPAGGRAMTYSVKEIFLTLQGEGGQAGRAAVFCRFAGCNLWTGREQDRADAVCQFCDTDFVGTDGPGGGKFTTPAALAEAVEAAWGAGPDARLVVCTGGEPLLQLDEPLIAALHARGFEVAVETNGTLPAPAGLDWVCVSPKAGAPLVQTRGQELKLVYPQAGADPAAFEHLAFERFFLQPMDGPDVQDNTRAAVAYCLAHPRWRLSVQTHKHIGLP